MKNILVDMLKAQGFTAAQSMEFACEHTLLSKKYEKQVQTCWYGERTSTLEVKLFVNLEAGICRVWVLFGRSAGCLQGAVVLHSRQAHL